jgi:hypothetical protein
MFQDFDTKDQCASKGRKNTNSKKKSFFLFVATV